MEFNKYTTGKGFYERSNVDLLFPLFLIRLLDVFGNEKNGTVRFRKRAGWKPYPVCSREVEFNKYTTGKGLLKKEWWNCFFLYF